MGWKKDENGEYHGVWRRLANAEFRKLFHGDNLDIEEVDEAIGTLSFVSLLCVTHLLLVICETHCTLVSYVK